LFFIHDPSLCKQINPLLRQTLNHAHQYREKSLRPDFIPLIEAALASERNVANGVAAIN